jgi:hypothetical protein
VSAWDEEVDVPTQVKTREKSEHCVHLQKVDIRNETRHNLEVAAVAEQLPQEAQQLPSRDVVLAEKKVSVLGKEVVEIALEVLSNCSLVLGEQLLES